MSELKAINAYQLTTNTEDSDVYIHNDEFECGGDLVECYLKSEADKVIAEKDTEIAQLQAMLEGRNKQVWALKHRIAPKQSDKTLQERLNEVCEKHGVSTLQDLDWAFCESEKRRTKDIIDAVNIIYHQKYKRCLAMARWCGREAYIHKHGSEYDEDLVAWFGKWNKRWLELAEQFKPNTTATKENNNG